MWDALRLNAKQSSTPLVRNVIGVEAAIWQEAFWPEGSYTYARWEKVAEGAYQPRGEESCPCMPSWQRRPTEAIYKAGRDRAFAAAFILFILSIHVPPPSSVLLPATPSLGESKIPKFALH